MTFFRKLNGIFNKKTKIKIAILIFGIITGAIIETGALAIIGPFISVAMDSSIVETNEILRYVYNLLGFESTDAFLAFLAFLLAFVYVFKGVYIFTLNRLKYRFVSRQQIALSHRIMEIIMAKPYIYHVNRNIAEIKRTIQKDVAELIRLMTIVLSLASDMFMSTFIFILLFSTSVPLSLGVIFLSTLCIAIYFKIFRKKIRDMGKENREKYLQMSKTVNQSIGSIKELKVLRREGYFLDAFEKNSKRFAKTNRQFNVYDKIPKLMIESICFGGAFVLVGSMILGGADIGYLVPQLSLFVLAAFRLLPAVARFAGYVNKIIFYRPSVDAVYNNLQEGKEEEVKKAFPNPMETGGVQNRVAKDIVIKNVTFQYPNTKEPVLDNVSFTIPARKSVAFIGPTGAGKTTLADIILGIYEPDKGQVLYDGKSIHHDLVWGSNLGYIPQQIYLLDESITANIAFGIPEDEIDINKVKSVLEKVQMSKFVESLPDKLDTVVGDRGARLSGGQRQRIGIARALYSDPDILVMDEATSALDNETEKAVMEAIERFKGSITMIIIAHRLTTIENCDIICRVDNKSITIEKDNR